EAMGVSALVEPTRIAGRMAVLHAVRFGADPGSVAAFEMVGGRAHLLVYSYATFGADGASRWGRVHWIGIYPRGRVRVAGVAQAASRFNCCQRSRAAT